MFLWPRSVSNSLSHHPCTSPVPMPIVSAIVRAIAPKISMLPAEFFPPPRGAYRPVLCRSTASVEELSFVAHPRFAKNKDSFFWSFPLPIGGSLTSLGRRPSKIRPDRGCASRCRVELLQIELGSQSVGNFAQALPFLAQCLCAGQRGLLRRAPRISTKGKFTIPSAP